MAKRVILFYLIGIGCCLLDCLLPHPRVYAADPFSGSILIGLAISAATTAASVGIEYLVAKNRKVSPVDRGKLDDVRVSIPGYGEAIPKCWGTFRCAPVWFWHTPIVHTTVTTPGRSGGKGGSPRPPTPETVDHVYTTSLAGVFHDGPVSSVVRMWFDGDLVYNTSTTLSASKYEAESATLAGGANSTASSACSGGLRVQGIGSGGTVTFSVTVDSTTTYDLGIYYTSTVDRTFKVSVNGGATTDVVCIASGGVNVVAIQTLSVALNSGANTIAFSNAGAAAPDLDKIEVAPALVFDPDGIDPRSWTGLLDPDIIPPTDQDRVWPYFNHRPEATATGVFATNLAKYGQPSIRIYTGTETQTADSAIIADKGAANAPAYRGCSYVVIDGMQLQAGRIPNVTLEVDQGTTNLATITGDVYDLVGVTSGNREFTALAGDTLTGLMVPSRRAAADVIAELQTRFQFDLPEVDGKVKAVLRNGTSDLTIPYSELRAHYDGEEAPAFDALITDIDPLLLPARVDVNHLDPAMDYHNNTQSDMRLVGPQFDNQSVSLSLVDSATNVKKLASILLYKPDREGRAFRFTTGPKYMRAHQGTVITLTLQNATHIVRVTEARYGLPAGVCEFEAVRQQASLYSPTGTGSTSTGIESPIAPIPGNTKGIIIDGPLLRAEDAGDGTQIVVYVAMCGRGSGTWPGGFFYQEFPINSGNYKFLTLTDKPSGIGVTVGMLGSVSDPSVWDRTNSLVINFFSNTTLSSVTEQELLANPELNLLGVINPSTNAVEYVQFKTATAGAAVAPYVTNYTVGTFLRGRVGSDGNVGAHTSADDVVVIDSTVLPRRMAVADVERTLKFKFVTSGQSVDDAAEVTQTLRGNSLRPLAPVNLTGTRDALGNLLLQWTGRSRINPGMIPGSDVPIGEDEEIYNVEIMDGASVVRSIVVRGGGSQPAVLAGIVQPGVVSGNNFGPGSGDQAFANVVQSLGPEAFVEATLTYSTASSNASMAFVEQAYIDWIAGGQIGTLGTNHYSAISFRNLSGLNKFNVTDTAPPGSAYNSDDLGTVTNARIRATLSDTGVRYYWDYMGEASVPFYVSRAIPTFPAFCLIELGGTGEARNINVGRTFKRSTVYTVEQQTSDFGAVENPVTVRVSQVSAVVGAGPYVEGSF